MTEESWTEKHRPTTLDEIQGNNKAVRQLREWAENWSEGDNPRLLFGDPGTGKTTTAMILADRMGYPINEINTSTARTSDDIERISAEARSSPTDAEYQLVLLDECDSWHHAANKKPLYETLRESKNPMILTANSKYDTPQAIKKACKQHKFSLRKSSRRSYLRDVAEKEGLDIEKDTMNRLSQRPDLRSAINDLQNISDGSPVNFDERVWSTHPYVAIGQFKNLDMDAWRRSMGTKASAFDTPEDAIMWVEQAVKEEFRGFGLGVGMNGLQLADLQLGRARSSQDYRYWKYASAILTEMPCTRLTTPWEAGERANTPEWFSQSSVKFTDGSPEATLYRELKGDRDFTMAGSYFQFRQQTLPILRGMSEEDRYEMALDHGLSETAVEGLEMDPSEYDNWVDIEEPEEGDGWTPDTQAVSQADW